MSNQDLRHDPVVIVSAVRTPMGGFQGDLAAATAPELGATAIRAALERAGLGSDSIEEVIMGCVLPAGLGQAPRRHVFLPWASDPAAGADLRAEGWTTIAALSPGDTAPSTCTHILDGTAPSPI